jgi:hypothetical protein
MLAVQYSGRVVSTLAPDRMAQHLHLLVLVVGLRAIFQARPLSQVAQARQEL